MRVSLHGLDPVNQEGYSFYADCRVWQPMWQYVCCVCCDVLVEAQKTECRSAQGITISPEQTKAIAKRVAYLSNEGVIERYLVSRRKFLDNLPDVECNLCRGTGWRNDHFVTGTCNKCGGTGATRPEETKYSFSLPAIRMFVTFLENCGGCIIR